MPVTMRLVERIRFLGMAEETAGHLNAGFALTGRGTLRAFQSGHANTKTYAGKVLLLCPAASVRVMNRLSPRFTSSVIMAVPPYWTSNSIRPEIWFGLLRYVPFACTVHLVLDTTLRYSNVSLALRS